VTNNETNLAKWTAFALATDPEAVGHTLNELANEIARLRRVCCGSEMCIMNATSGHVTSVERVRILNCVRKDLADAGKEATDGNV